MFVGYGAQRKLCSTGHRPALTPRVMGEVAMARTLEAQGFDT